jgi:hypothetical protein
MNTDKLQSLPNPTQVELIEIAPGVKVTQDFINELPEHQLKPFIDGFTDMLEGRVIPHEEVVKQLKLDAQQNCLESKRTSII